MARKRQPGQGVHGVVVLDKPRGPTSHDLVQIVRRAIGTHEVGHAGTLDPMATGVLVVAIGQATKLLGWLSAADKSYEARVAFGRATDTLDAEGETTGARACPAEIAAACARAEDGGPLAAALAAERARTAQVPPAVSAIKGGGVSSHARARRGAEGREVRVRAERVAEVARERADVVALRDGHLEVEPRRVSGSCGRRERQHPDLPRREKDLLPAARARVR